MSKGTEISLGWRRSGDAHGFTVLADTPDHLLALRSDLYLVHARTGLSVESLETFRQAGVKLRALHPEPVLLLVTVPRASKPPDDAVRQLLAKLLGEYRDRTVAEAFVTSGVGFDAATARGVVTSVRTLARADMPASVFDAPGPAVSWLVSQRPPACHGESAAVLAEAVERLLEASTAAA